MALVFGLSHGGAILVDTRGEPYAARVAVQPCCPRWGRALENRWDGHGPTLERRVVSCPDDACAWRGDAVWWVSQE